MRITKKSRRPTRFVGIMFLCLLTSAAVEMASMQEGAQQAIRGTVTQGAVARPETITFQIWTALDKLGGHTEDLITIQFCRSSGQVITPPLPALFGDDVLQEFTVSGRDLQQSNPFKFSRTLRDTRFIEEARYIRVINHGSDAWAGDRISITLAGRPILDRSMYPRKGSQPNGGIEKFNRSQWSLRKYWEGDLLQIRGATSKY